MQTKEQEDNDYQIKSNKKSNLYPYLELVTGLHQDQVQVK